MLHVAISFLVVCGNEAEAEGCQEERVEGEVQLEGDRHLCEAVLQLPGLGVVEEGELGAETVWRPVMQRNIATHQTPPSSTQLSPVSHLRSAPHTEDCAVQQPAGVAAPAEEGCGPLLGRPGRHAHRSAHRAPGNHQHQADYKATQPRHQVYPVFPAVR